MSDGLKMLSELLQAGKTPEVAAVFPAVPGWHAVIVQRTGLSDADDPNAKYGSEYVRVLAFPIVQWGISCPPKFIRRSTDDEKTRPRGSGPDLMGMLGNVLGVSREPDQTILPLDPREDAAKFFDVNELFGVFPPSEGSGQEVAQKALAIIEAISEKEIERHKKKEEKTG